MQSKQLYQVREVYGALLVYLTALNVFYFLIATTIWTKRTVRMFWCQSQSTEIKRVNLDRETKKIAKILNIPQIRGRETAVDHLGQCGFKMMFVVLAVDLTDCWNVMRLKMYQITHDHIMITINQVRNNNEYLAAKYCPSFP